MNSREVRSNVWKSTLSGYVRIVVRMGLGLVSFRLLFQGLDQEEFGFWSLLWAIFGYGILLDFGFGYAAQKRVAELSVKKDWDGLAWCAPDP
jgi:O-antigen/teichoic acid export membrane protein